MYKRFVFLVVLLVSVLVFAFYSCQNRNPMMGSWRMKSGVYLGPDGSTNSAPVNSRQLKVINDTHFTTLWQNTDSNENMGFNGGKYSYANGIYTEYLEFFSISGRLGDTAYFKVDFKENSLSISACDQYGKVSEMGYFQVWEKME